MYQPKDQYKRILGTINLLSEKSEKEITRVLNVYDISLEEFNNLQSETFWKG